MNFPAIVRANGIATARPAELTDVRDWLERLRREWDGMTPGQRDSSQLPAIVDRVSSELEAAQAPAGPKATAVLLDKLFAVVPMPSADGLAIWIELLEAYPADEIAQGVDALIRSHRWPHPPLIADLIGKIEASDLRQERARVACALMMARFRVKNPAVVLQPCASDDDR